MINEPCYYFNLFTDLPQNINVVNEINIKKDFIHYFTERSNDLLNDISSLRDEIEPNGIIWISWPKKTSKVTTDMNENVVRDVALTNGLVDIKVCAVDETWSGLKLVIPVKDRI